MNTHWTNGSRPDTGYGYSARLVQTMEVAVFLFLIVPSLAASFFIANQLQLSFTATAISSILNDLALMSLVFYLIWRNGESPGQIGWTSRGLKREILWGVLLFVPVSFGASALENALHAAGLSAPPKPPGFLVAAGPAKVILGVALVTVVALAEETVFRGYLLLRFMAVTGRSAAAVLLSAVIFSLGHGYEGVAGLLTVLFLGIVLAVVYLWRQSLTAPMVMHFLIDFSSIVLMAPQVRGGP